MPTNRNSTTEIDWSLTTWDGSRREQLRRWAALPLEQMIESIEQMEDLGERLALATAIVSSIPYPRLPESDANVVCEPLPRGRDGSNDE
jgi:hypothetical protein